MLPEVIPPVASMPTASEDVSAMDTVREPLVAVMLLEIVVAPGLPVIVIVLDSKPEGRSSNNVLRAVSCNEQ